MLYALLNGERISAEDANKSNKDFYKCPCCSSDLVIKQGDFKIWHFAHKSKNDCSLWFKPMTEWHKSWQMLFPKHNREVIHICPVTGEKHIADIKTDNGVIIEFQHSSISAKEIQSRENFYGEKMIWVLDANSFNIKMYKSIEEFDHQNNIDFMLNKSKKHIDEFKYQIAVKLGCHEDFIYSHLKKSMQVWRDLKNMTYTETNKKIFDVSKRHIFIDFGEKMFYLKYKKNTKIAIHKNNIFSNFHEGAITDFSRANYNIDIYGDDLDESYGHINLYGLKISKTDCHYFKEVNKKEFIKKYTLPF